MKHATMFCALLLVSALASGCTENTAPGNDRAADKAPPKPAAEVVPAPVAVGEADPSSTYPETMTQEEVRKVVQGGSCSFTYTRVGHPVVAIEVPRAGADLGRGLIKLNGKLAELRPAGSGSRDYVSGTTTMRAPRINVTIEAGGETENVDDKHVREAALRFKLEGAEEVGFWGFYVCDPRRPDTTASDEASRKQGKETAEGAKLYKEARCFACHGGLGDGTAGPRFAGHENLSEDRHVISAILKGPGIMPSYFDSLTDKQIAAVSTYIRTTWGNNYGEVTPQRVAEIRASLGESWLSIR